MVTAALAIAVFMVALWIISLVLKNASIVDIGWGIGFVIVAWAVRARVDGNADRQRLLVTMTALWGLRLAGYLYARNHGKGEDFRYRAMRKHWGPRFPLISLGTVFAVQGVLMWIVSLPVQLGQVELEPKLGGVAFIGIILWAIGFFFEVIGDAQLVRFKRDPTNAGKVLDQGLWRYTRHPNYFGDCCVWWGLYAIAAATPLGIWTVLSPLAMTFLLLRVSGVALLERSIGKRRPDYADYIARTSAFVPLPPRRRRS